MHGAHIYMCNAVVAAKRTKHEAIGADATAAEHTHTFIDQDPGNAETASTLHNV